MSARPEPSADEIFTDRAFLVRDAVRLGYGEGIFKHPRWHRPFPGMRAKTPLADDLYGRALQYLPRLREGELFSHATALAVLGCPIRVPHAAPVDVSAPTGISTVECRGAIGHRHVPGAPHYSAIHPDRDEATPVVPPLAAVHQAAPRLPFPELVVALDFLLLQDQKRYDPHLRVRREELAQFADRVSGRGAIRFREAAALARVGAESRMETLMRLANTRAGGPELRLQFELRSIGGAWIGRSDAVDEDTRSIFEYDGEQHSFLQAAAAQRSPEAPGRARRRLAAHGLLLRGRARRAPRGGPPDARIQRQERTTDTPFADGASRRALRR